MSGLRAMRPARPRQGGCHDGRVPLLGTETEYGIIAPEAPQLDAHALSALVVEHCGVPATPAVEESRNRVLGNGARLYVDHGHPEYATPETTSAGACLLWELAGDRIVADAAAAASRTAGVPIRVFKNNTDGKGASYGYHENVLLRRSTPWEQVEAALPTLLVTRVLLGGAGRVGWGTRSERPGFQLSQRADFFERVSGLDTTQRRGIVNTRDEPHAWPRQWRRLHVIAGDATRSPFQTWLSLGVLALCLAALEDGALPVRPLADPVAAFRAVSRDLTLATPLPLADGRSATAREIQADLWAAADAWAVRASFPEASALLTAWRQVLDDLERGVDAVADRLDWAAKLTLLRGYRRRDGLVWDAPKLHQVDLAWAELGERSLPDRLLRAGRLRPGPDAADLDAARTTPPADTRAHTRGTWVARHPERVVAATWDSLLVRDSAGGLHSLGLRDPFRHTASHTQAGASADIMIRGHDREDP